ACQDSSHDLCMDVARSYADKGIAELKIPPDAKLAASIYSRRCTAGSQRACEAGAKLVGKGGAGLDADKKRARDLSVRACQLTSPDDDCDLCSDDPQCLLGRSEMCEVVGRRFRDAGGIPKDHLAAARHFRRGCDGAQKSSCAALDELCVADTSFDRELCHQSLIHSDLFYEAEWQFRTTGVAKIAGDEPDKAGTPVGAVAVAENAAGGGGGVG